MNRIILFLLILAGSYATAQINKKLDSLLLINQKYLKQDTVKVRILVDIAVAYEEVNLEKALEKANEAVALAKQLNIPFSLAKAYDKQASVLMLLGNYVSSISAFNKAIEIYKTLGKMKEQIRLTNSLGNLYYLSSDFLKAKAFYEKAAKEAEKIGDKFTQAKALCNMGNACVAMSEYPQSIVFYEKGIQLFELLNDKKSVVRNIGNLGNSYQSLGNYKKALEYYFKARKMNEAMGNTFDLANNLLNIAYSYHSIKDYENDLKHTKQALSKYESIGNKNNMTVAAGNIGNTYGILGDFKKAIYYNNIVLKLGEEMQDTTSLMRASIDLSANYSNLKEFSKAFYYLNKLKDYDEESVTSSTKIGLALGTATLLRISPDVFLKANGYSLKDRYTKAEGLLKSALTIAQEINNKLEEVKILTELSLMYEKQGNFEKAFESYKKAIEINKEVETEETKREITRKEIQFDYDKKEAQLKYNQQLVLKKVETQRLMLFSLLVLICLAGVIIYLRQKQKTLKQDKFNSMNFTKQLLENTEGERKRIASDLHDSISHELLNLKSMFKHDFTALNTKVDTIINDIRGISRNLHPMMFDKIGLVPNIELLIDRIQNQNSFFISTDISYAGTLTSAIELQIYRIIQESLTNIIKYAKAHAAKISILETEKKIIIEIKDNGIGFDVKQTLNSGKAFGLHSIIERSRVIGGEANIQSSAEGTIINIDIPKKS